MKIIQDNSHKKRVICPECGSILELENESEEWDWYSEILDCPICHKHKKRNV